MNVSQLRAMMRRYKTIGVLLVGAYLGAHHLWAKRRGLLLLLGSMLPGIGLLFWQLHDTPPARRPSVPFASSPRSQVLAPHPPKKAPIFQTPNFDRWKHKVPYYAHWGAYTVVVEQIGNDESGGPQRVRILGPGNEVLREVRAYAITAVDLEKLTGNSPAELHISLWSGGAYASFAEVYFTQKNGLHNILAFDRDDEETWEVVDLNHDGIPEIVAENPVLGDFSAYNFHRHWPVITILEWDGKQYADVTSHYPTRSLKEANERRAGIQDCLKIPKDERRGWDFQDKVTAYYANMLSIGRGDVARRWLKRHLDASDWAWVQVNDAELRQIIATALERRSHVSQNKILDQSDFPRRLTREEVD